MLLPGNDTSNTTLAVHVCERGMQGQRGVLALSQGQAQERPSEEWHLDRVVGNVKEVYRCMRGQVRKPGQGNYIYKGYIWKRVGCLGTQGLSLRVGCISTPFFFHIVRNLFSPLSY